jgi:hypothetical protein
MSTILAHWNVKNQYNFKVKSQRPQTKVGGLKIRTDSCCQFGQRELSVTGICARGLGRAQLFPAVASQPAGLSPSAAPQPWGTRNDTPSLGLARAFPAQRSHAFGSGMTS